MLRREALHILAKIWLSTNDRVFTTVNVAQPNWPSADGPGRFLRGEFLRQ
jgi:hypothetical protein